MPSHRKGRTLTWGKAKESTESAKSKALSKVIDFFGAAKAEARTKSKNAIKDEAPVILYKIMNDVPSNSTTGPQDLGHTPEGFTIRAFTVGGRSYPIIGYTTDDRPVLGKMNDGSLILGFHREEDPKKYKHHCQPGHGYAEGWNIDLRKHGSTFIDRITRENSVIGEQYQRELDEYNQKLQALDEQAEEVVAEKYEQLYLDPEANGEKVPFVYIEKEVEIPEAPLPRPVAQAPVPRPPKALTQAKLDRAENKAARARKRNTRSAIAQQTRLDKKQNLAAVTPGLNEWNVQADRDQDDVSNGT
ncbi:hypothetical protein EJ08DRAFT_735764 [Tothia fuscella]|uniref:Uncharacterized protein n=1 Tax=Tothia fuscella TaxID=1048955 RepID=A0A9P4TWQ2_9PEZI|nr:hypothetical protein EJ08DRAFT_735764 [Tothia fuscella]